MTNVKVAPQVISKILAEAGFRRSSKSKSRIGQYRSSEGFSVHKNYDGDIVVDWNPGFDRNPERIREKQERFLTEATAILEARGFKVVRDHLDRLVVSK